MIKIYGMPSCKDCAYVHEQLQGREAEFEYINIGEDVKKLKEFLRIRDNSPVFEECKAGGSAGIPCFVKEDGSVTLVPEEVGLCHRPAEGTSCRLDGTGC